jgi:hypothetical protein
LMISVPLTPAPVSDTVSVHCVLTACLAAVTEMVAGVLPLEALSETQLLQPSPGVIVNGNPLGVLVIEKFWGVGALPSG